MMRFALPPMRQATGPLVLLLGLLAPMATAAQSRRTASPAPLHVLAGMLPAPTAASVSAVGSTSTCISIAQEVRMQEAGTWKPGSQTPLCTANPGLASQDRISRLKPNASAASSLEYEPSSDVASTVIPGGGFSGFQLAPSYQASPTPLNYSCTMLTLSADFLRTGHKDVVTIDSRTQLHFLANKGDGTFAAPVTTNFLPTGSYYTGYATALVDDFDNDGYPDLIVRDTTDSLIVFLRNNHDGTFTNSKSISIPTTYYGGALMLGDVTGDGVADLVIFRTTYSYSTSSTDLNVYVYAGNGTGDFSATPIETDYTFEQSLVVIPNQGAQLGANAGRSALYIEALSLNSYGINGSTVFALPVNGDGTFGDTPYTQQDFATANLYVNTFNSGMSLADLNGDGIPDLTMSFMDGYIYSALGQSDGTFPSVVVASPTVEVHPQSWAIRDIDGDGIPDFVAKESISLEVLPGLGTGKFGTAPIYYAAISSSSGHSQNSPGFNMVLDDLDGDGVLDLAYVDGSSGGYNRLNVFHGYGDGTYFGGATLPAQSLLGYDAGHLYGQALLDTNGDGYDDILSLDTYGSGDYPYRTALNDGKGGFTFVKALDGAYGKYGLGYVQAVADLNRDGLKDLVLDASTLVSSYTYNYTLAVAVSNGDGSFRTPTFLDMNGTALTSNLASVAVGDINADGVADIVAVTAGGYYGTAAVITFLGNSDGTFQPAITQPFGHSYAYAGITLADLNGDGKLDLLISDDGTSGSISPYLSVIFGDNSGKFDTGAATTLISGLSVRTLQIGDVNGDGKPDLAVFSAGQQSGYSVSATDRGVILYLNNGDGTFTRGNTYDADMIPGKGLLVDINGDGKLDIINTVDYATDTPAGDNSGSHLLLGAGDGTFGTATNLGMEPGISTLAAGDLDGDGTTDLMSWSYYYGGVEVIRNISGSMLSLAADNTAIVDGDGVNLSATVTPSVAHRELPSGTVTFLANGTVLGTATLRAGTATFYASELPVGADTITAIYSGDSSFSATKSSSSLTVTVSAAPIVAPDFTLSAPTAALTLARGASGTTTFSVAANATFSGTLSLASSDLPDGMSVLFSPNSVALTPNGSATVTVVVSTTSSTVASSRVAAAWLFAMPLVGSLLCFGGARRRAFRLLMLALALSASFGAITALSGCGSDSPVRTTHTGDYTIVIKATPSVSGVAAKAFNVTVHVD